MKTIDNAEYYSHLSTVRPREFDSGRCDSAVSTDLKLETRHVESGHWLASHNIVMNYTMLTVHRQHCLQHARR